MKILYALGTALFLAGCGSSDSDPQPSFSYVEAAVQTEAEKLVLGKLKDPDSAKFSEVHVSSRSGHPVACGKVNSKNGFGGMAGAQRFVSNGGDVTVLEEETQTGAMNEVRSRFC